MSETFFLHRTVVTTNSFTLRAYDAVILKALQEEVTEVVTDATTVTVTETTTTDSGSTLAVSLVLFISSFVMYRLF